MERRLTTAVRYVHRELVAKALLHVLKIAEPARAVQLVGLLLAGVFGQVDVQPRVPGVPRSRHGRSIVALDGS